MTSTPATNTPAWLADLIARARQADGQPPFSDQSLVDLRTGARALVAIDQHAAALASVDEAEFVVDPAERGRGLGTALLDRLLAEAPGELLIWAHGDHPAARALARSHSLEAVRELLHLRLDLAITSSPAAAPSSGTGSPAGSGTSSGVTIDTFVVGRDETEWLALNARAFAHHPEQGRVTGTDLDELLREEWFRADDFLLARDGGHIVGYCWLKVDASGGEFYVVGIDPDSQGAGLGRRLTVAGLARLRHRGIRSAHLYVEGDNTAAVRLYRSLGFDNDSIDIQYRAPAR
ncbi:mycothiol synthase [Glaciihabitans tibetensis]|uniref:mycothiol synthase n=1 Tax=Glaciihabitans tibetensis TaxID=1266600 RepID=UPI0015E69BF2|nr:mycothiol synthase [Glaciihabitans tibetensis]